MFCALITFPFAAGSAVGVAAFLLREVLGFSAVVLDAMYRSITYSSVANLRNTKKARSPHDEGEGPRSFPRYPPIGIDVYGTPGLKPGQPSSGCGPGGRLGAQALPRLDSGVVNRCLGRPNDVDGRVQRIGPVTPAVARPQALAEAALGVVGSERVAAGARDQCIHRML